MRDNQFAAGRMKLGYRPDEVAEVFGSEQLFRQMVAAGWLVPVEKRRKLTLYDAADIRRAWARIVSGERPA